MVEGLLGPWLIFWRGGESILAAYWGKILWIDLDGFTSRVEELSPDVFRQ